MKAKQWIPRIPRRALYVLGVVSLCVIGVSAFHMTTRASATSNPFQGISAAENAPVLPPDTPAPAWLAPDKQFLGADVSAARVLPMPIAGQTAYVMPTASGGFCLFVWNLGGGCNTPLTNSMPVLFGVSGGDADAPAATAYGIAEDGVDSITMTVNGSRVTVPVKGNTFSFSGGPSVTSGSFTAVTANFDDGHSVALLG